MAPGPWGPKGPIGPHVSHGHIGPHGPLGPLWAQGPKMSLSDDRFVLKIDIIAGGPGAQKLRFDRKMFKSRLEPITLDDF